MPDLRRRLPSAKLPSRSAFQSTRKFQSTKADRLSGVKISAAEADAILEDLANNDSDSKKTWSRLFVENYLSKYDWYWPRRNDPNAPSLLKAWTYYEHVTLPRHFIGDEIADTVFRRAEPGEHEEETELFDTFRTPQSAMIEWGTGIDLYFISLKFFAVIMLVAGLMNISSIAHFAGDDYNGDSDLSDIAYPLRGSAICSNTDWVVCTDCELEQRTRDNRGVQDWWRDKGRIAFGVNEETGQNTTLVLKNLCQGAELKNGISNLVTLIFVLFAVGIFSMYLRAREVRFDEDKVTTTDYSIEVKNPPPDAIDPDVWRDFFSQFATDGDQVTVATVALNNEQLVQRLLNRRNYRNQLRWKLPDGTDLDDENTLRVAVDKFMEEKAEQGVGCIMSILQCTLVPILNLIGMMLPPDELMERITTLTEEIKELQNEKYDANRVFITFETEEGQRAALSALNCGMLDRVLNRTGAVAPECLFEGKVLHVSEPTEPNAVRWLDLSYGTTSKLIRRCIVLFLTVCMVCLAGFAIAKARESVGPSLSGPLTTIFNSTIPFIIKLLMIIEPHSTEGGFQASLYLKITMFRWSLSAILTQIITPTTSTLGSESTDLLPTIYAILLSDVWLSPLLRLSDWMTNINKHILAPRSNSQEEMNRNFQGTYYNLGERYTDFTKILFVVFFYSALFPAGYFFGFVILTFQYFSDRFSLLRIWGWQPLLGSELAVFSRRFFFTGATIAFAVVSSYAWVQFPYDNVCTPLDGDEISSLSGAYLNVVDGNGVPIQGGSVDVSQDTNVVYCDQSWRGYIGFGFPATPRLQTDNKAWTAAVSDDDLTWMTDSQHVFTLIYGWFTVFVVFCFSIGYFGGMAYNFVLSIFIGMYEPEGEQQHIDFSSNPEIFAYVPQIKQVGQPFPYLVCDIDGIDQGLVGWNDEANSYDFYNLIFDIPHKSLRRTTMLTENTRGVTTIAEHQEYHSKGSPEETHADGGNGFEVREPTGRPIYSIIKHYPTKWQIKLAEEESWN